MFDFDLQLFGGGGKGGSSSSSSYTPSEQELQLQQYALDNANIANSGVKSLLNQFNSGVTSSDFSNLLSNANSQINSGQNTISSLTNGELPSAAQENITNNLKTMVTSSLGSAINNLANHGVLGTAEATKMVNDIDTNVTNTANEQQQNYMSLLGNLANSQISNATAGYSPYSTLQTLGTNQQTAYVTNPLNAISGKGTTTNTTSGSSWGDLLTSAAFGLGTGWAGKQMGLK